VALLLFGVPTLLGSIAQTTIEGFPPSPGVASMVIVAVAVLVAAVLGLFGPVIFSGYLDEAIGREYLFGHHITFGEVLRSLPWIRLLIASAIVAVVTGFGLSLFVVPGVLFFMLFGLIGPVIVQERRTLIDGFRRTFALSRRALLIIAVLVLVPTILEIGIEEIVHDLAHDSGLGIQVVAEWLVAVFLFGAVGVIEVALAAELMARYPDPDGSLREALLDDGQGPTVSGNA
jgi:hypothetical protein